MSYTRDSHEVPRTLHYNPAKDVAEDAEAYRLLAGQYGLAVEIEKDSYSADVRIIGARSSVVVEIVWTPFGSHIEIFREFDNGDRYPVESLRSHLQAVKAGC
jgi:hypothetical protein